MKTLPLLFLSFMTFAQINYPNTKKVEQKDNYHGTEVNDPYRWLEDDQSDETKEWVKQQNDVTFNYLGKIKSITNFKERLNEVYNYPKYSSPSRKGEWFYFYKNDGLQNQYVLYRQKGLDGQPELVLDPNLLSEEGTTRMTQFKLSKNGEFAAVALSEGGSDWQQIKIMNTQSKEFLNDLLKWVKVSSIAWQGNGFYYSRYPAPEGSELASINENHQVYYHIMGTNQDQDQLIYEDKTNKQRFHTVQTTEDQDFAILTISDRGTGKEGNSLFYLTKGETEFRPIIKEISNSAYGIIDYVDSKFLIETNDKAPNSKIISFDINTKEIKTVVEEKEEPIQSASTAGGKLFVSYLKDVITNFYVFSLNGTLENQVDLPGLGSTGGFYGNKDDKSVFYTYSSFTTPPTIYNYEIATTKSSKFREPEIKFNSDDFETKQVFYTSKDGTQVPMFITYKKGLVLNSKNPTILYGYGGFKVNLNPGFNPLLVPFLEKGGVYAQANLRGGSEYGETWHQQGMKANKQNVFDDFIAAADYLKKEKYCNADHLALRGGSNGGLLVGAVINQQPDIAKVAIPQVGVMDMLRFHKFTIGWNWIADYGSSDKPDEFAYLIKYSPLHNIKENAAYPATLITTADHDDRVVPAHSFKYAATLQEKAGKSSTNPLLIRVGVNSGHGASNTQKNIELYADIYGFIFNAMGI